MISRKYMTLRLLSTALRLPDQQGIQESGDRRSLNLKTRVGFRVSGGAMHQLISIVMKIANPKPRGYQLLN